MLSTGVCVRLVPFQNLLMLLMQQYISKVSPGVGLGATRPRLRGEPAATMPESQLRIVDAPPDFVRRVLIGPSDQQTTFSITGVVMNRVSIRSAHSMRQVPFQIRLLNTSISGPAVPPRSSEQFSVGVEVSCVVDVRIQTFDAMVNPALLRLETRWMLGTNPDDPFSLSVDASTRAQPFETRFSSNRVTGVLLPNPCESAGANGSPLCGIAVTIQNVIGDALQQAIRTLERRISEVSGSLSSGRSTINHAIFVTGSAVGSGPFDPANEQFRYVAQMRWAVAGRGPRHHLLVFANGRARTEWRAMLTNRPLMAINPLKDFVAYTSSADLIGGMTPSLDLELQKSIPKIEMKLWKNFYFGDARRMRSGERSGAEELMKSFRGDPSAGPGTWLSAVPRRWAVPVENMAAAMRDTAFIVNRGDVPVAEDARKDAFAALEARLFGLLAEFFEGLPAAAITSDTDPPYVLPDGDYFIDAFLQTLFPPLIRSAGTPLAPSGSLRDAYDEVKQARLLLRPGYGDVGTPTRDERARARLHLRQILADCAGYQARVSPIMASPISTRFPPLPSGIPSVADPLDPRGRLNTIVADRAQDVANRVLKDALSKRWNRVPTGLNAADTAAATTERNDTIRLLNSLLASRSASARCRALEAVVRSDGTPEPQPIQIMDVLRLIDITDGGAVYLGRDDWDAGIMRDLARGLEHVTIEHPAQMSIENERHPAVVFRTSFAIRLVRLLREVDLPIPGDDLILFSNTRVTIQFAPADTPQTPEEARRSPGATRSLVITIEPSLEFPLDEQPQGLAAVALATVIAAAAVFVSTQVLVGIFGVPGLLSAAADVVGAGFGIEALASNPPAYSRSLAEHVDFNDILRSLLGPLLRPHEQLPDPVVSTRPHRFVYTLADFEKRFLGDVPPGISGLSSLQSTLDTSDGVVRFSGLAPSALFVTTSDWAARDISTALLPNGNVPDSREGGVGLDTFPTVSTSLRWNLCHLHMDAVERRAQASGVSTPFTPVRPTTNSTVPVKIFASFSPYTVVGRMTISEVTIRGDGFRSVLAAGTVQMGVVPLRLANAPVSIPMSVTPTPRSPVLVVPLQEFAVVAEVSAWALLDALRTATTLVAQIVITTNVGQVVADFSSKIELLREWEPLLGNANVQEADAILNGLDLACTERMRARIIDAPVGTLLNPFPSSVLRDGSFFPDMGAEGDLPLGALDPVLYPHLRPAPGGVGEPRPVADRHWLFTPSASPVPRLDSIADLALRASRPQPATPSG